MEPDVDFGLLRGNEVWICRLKLKLAHYTPHRRLRDRRYTSYSFSNSELEGSEWSASRPSRTLAPGKGPSVPIAQEAGWVPEPVWTEAGGKILSPLQGIETSFSRSSSP
jgi:hypothetical protein